MPHRLLFLFFFFIVWQGSIFLFQIPDYMLPSPLMILQKIIEKRSYLLFHLSISFLEISLGLSIGFILALTTSLFLDRFQRLEHFLMPYLITLKNIPIFVTAPLLLLWFGHGIGPKAFLISLSCYFPMTVGLLEGLKHLPHYHKDFLSNIGATSWLPTFFYIRLPHALPPFFTGFRLALMHAPLSVIACDWIGSSSGLGYVMMLCYGQMDLALMFGCLFLLMAMSLFFYFLSNSLHRYIYHKFNLHYL